MQGLADGYFVLPYTIGNYLAPLLGESTLDESDSACATVVNDVAERTQKWLSVNGTRSVDWFHRELGKLVWNFIGMERDKNGLEKALSEIPSLREEFEKDVRVLGTADNLNTCLLYTSPSPRD